MEVFTYIENTIPQISLLLALFSGYNICTIVSFYCVKFTVEPLLTATSLQRQLFSVPADSPYITSCLNPSTTANSPQRQRPVFSATDEKVKNIHEI